MSRMEIDLGPDNWKEFVIECRKRQHLTPSLRLKRSYKATATKVEKHFQKDYSKVEFKGLQKLGVTYIMSKAYIDIVNGELNVDPLVEASDGNCYSVSEATGKVEVFTDEELKRLCREAKEIDFYE